MASPTTLSPIPLIYRLVFTYIDPLFCLLGFYQHIFEPARTAASYTSSAASVKADAPSDIGTQHVLANLAAFFGYMFVLEAVLLRIRSNDTTVWRIVQGAGAMLDAIMTVAAIRQMNAQGRLLRFDTWQGEDWHHVTGNAVFGVLRLACAAGLGMRLSKGKHD